MTNWPKKEFESIYEIPSRNGLSKPSKVRGTGYKMINMGELFSNNRIYDIDMELVPLTDAEKEKAKVEPGDLLFARQSLVAEGAGKCIIVMETSELTVFESHIIRVRLNKEQADPLFYYYYFRSPASPMKTIVQHCVQAGIKASDLSKLEVIVPPLSEQQKIASIFNSIDAKIENNNRINQNLYEQIQTIYCKDFDPVSHEATGVLSNICKYSTDKVQIADLSVSTYYSTENMQPNKAGAIDASSLPSVSQTTKCSKGDVLISNIRPYFKKIVYVTENCGCSTDVLCFVPQTDYSAFLFGTLYMDRFFDYMVAGSKGTKMPRGDKQQIMKYPIVVPTTEEIFAFNAAVTPMLEQISINNNENTRLTTLLDTLLPRLMSGELDVSEIEL